MATDDQRPDASNPGGARPAISVLVPSHDGVRVTEASLESLARQTLAPSRFEVVVVVTGPADETRALVDTTAVAWPDLRLRLVDVGEAGVAAARNVALAAARGHHVVFLDGGDRLTASFLEAVLGEAGPGVVVAALATHPTEAAAATGRPDRESSVDRALTEHVGRTVRPEQLPDALTSVTAKLVNVELARLAGFDANHTDGAVDAYWLALAAHGPFSIRVVDPTEALYLRTPRPAAGREPTYETGVRQPLRCLQAIEDVDIAGPRAAALAQALGREQAGRVNGYLRRFSDQHPAVVTEAAAMGLRQVPWATVNEGLARDLAVCYNFPPWVDTSGMVAAKRLQRRGTVTDVVCQDLTGLRGRDRRTEQVAAEVLGRVHVATGPASLRDWWGIAPYAEETWRFVLEQEAVQGAYRSVYSRAMAVGSPFAAALVKLRRPEIHWVAEFSDPLFIGLVGEQRPEGVADDALSRELVDGMRAAGFEVGADLQVFEWAERLTYALADQIVFTNELQRQMMLDRLRDTRLVQRVLDRSAIDPHPQLPARFYDAVESELLRTEGAVHLAYFGAFYATRDLGALLEAFTRLRQDERDQVRLHVYTSRPDELTLRVLRAGLAGVVVAHRYVPALEFLNLTTKFDVLVVNDALTADHHAVNPYLPSKLADYAGSGTPIWAICEEGSSMSAMELAYTSPVGDADAALDVLRRLVAQR